MSQAASSNQIKEITISDEDLNDPKILYPDVIDRIYEYIEKAFKSGKFKMEEVTHITNAHKLFEDCKKENKLPLTCCALLVAQLAEISVP